MTPKKLIVRSLVIPSVLLMTACSPYIYQEEVGKFQGGVEQASQMLDSQKELLSKINLEIIRSKLLEKGSPRLVVSEGCADAIIRLEVISYNNDSSEDLSKTLHKAAVDSCGVNTRGGLKVEVPTQLPRQTMVLATLSSYSKALAGIVDAEDKKSLSESASKACASAQQLYFTASRIGSDDKKKSEEEKTKKLEREGKAITAGCGLVTEIGTAILDHQRLKILTHVVNEGDSRVNLLATYLANESKKVNSIVLRNELELLNDSVEATVGLNGKDREYFESIDSAVLKKNKFVVVLKNNPEWVFLSMAEAHKKLKEAVNDPKTQLDAAIASIEKFHGIAKEAHEAFKALSKDDAEK